MHAAFRFAFVISLTVLLAACGGTIVPASSEHGDLSGQISTFVDPYGAEVELGGNAHILPIGDSGESNQMGPLGELGQTQQALGTPHLTYFGGPVIANVKVVTVFWRPTVNNQSQLNTFYNAVTNSAYVDWLSEYNTSSQHIGRGRLAASFVDRNSPASNSISDAQIQTEVSRLIGAGSVPANDGNTLYMVHFPAGVSITMGGSRSCVQFCAYHSTFRRNGTNVYYGVMPDLSGGCANGCGRSTYFNNTTSVSSHELVESITDAAVGLATTFGPPLAWYDRNNGEIGDICNAQQGSIAGYTVQLQWSNSRNACRLQ